MGIVALLLLWAAASTLLPSRQIVPTPWATMASVAQDFGGYYWPSITATLSRVGSGYLWGNIIALACAALVLLVPRVEQVVVQLGVISQCLPVTALGPILLLIWGGPTTIVLLAALLVFFTTMIGAILGLRSADSSALDLIAALGGGRMMRLRKVQLLSAVPAVVTALRVAVPAAVLGAVVGEFLGAVDSGMGVALVAAQREQMPERVWAMSILAGLLSLAGYALVGVLGRFLFPWTADRRAS